MFSSESTKVTQSMSYGVGWSGAQGRERSGGTVVLAGVSRLAFRQDFKPRTTIFGPRFSWSIAAQHARRGDADRRAFLRLTSMDLITYSANVLGSPGFLWSLLRNARRESTFTSPGEVFQVQKLLNADTKTLVSLHSSTVLD